MSQHGRGGQGQGGSGKGQYGQGYRDKDRHQKWQEGPGQQNYGYEGYDQYPQNPMHYGKPQSRGYQQQEQYYDHPDQQGWEDPHGYPSYEGRAQKYYPGQYEMQQSQHHYEKKRPQRGRKNQYPQQKGQGYPQKPYEEPQGQQGYEAHHHHHPQGRTQRSHHYSQEGGEYPTSNRYRGKSEYRGGRGSQHQIGSARHSRGGSSGLQKERSDGGSVRGGGAKRGSQSGGISVPKSVGLNPSQTSFSEETKQQPFYGHYYTQKNVKESNKKSKPIYIELEAGKVQPGVGTHSLPSSQKEMPKKSAGGKVLQTLSSIPVPEDRQQAQADSMAGPSLGTLEGIQSSSGLSVNDTRFTATMSALNTLDRGTFFLNENDKKVHFLVEGRKDLLGWYDTYVINGYLLHGVIIKVTTLTSRIFIFIENLHPLYKKYITVDEEKNAHWSEEMPDQEQLATLTSVEKVEVYDNDEEGFEGFVCYTICEDSQMEFVHTPQDVAEFKRVQQLILLYEPTSIRKIYLDVVYNSIYKPESKGFGGKRIAAIINPNVPAETIEFNKEIVTALDKKCIVGSIWIQNGKYTLTAETLEDMERFKKVVDYALDIAEELGAYVMITNLRRTFDYIGKTILYINSDPTLKLIRSSNQIAFASKFKKSENLL